MTKPINEKNEEDVVKNGHMLSWEKGMLNIFF